MFDSESNSTQKALLELRNIRSEGKPIVVWVGAGASRWAGYPTWNQLAESLHSEFLKFEPNYSKKAGVDALKENSLPTIFSLCKQANSSRYFRYLSDTLNTRPITSVYQRFIDLLKKIQPTSIVTTNIDRNLEVNLPLIPVYERENIDFVHSAIGKKAPFIYKLHGSSSSIERSIWTNEDYDVLADNQEFLQNLSNLLSRVSLVFIGYSLRDKYLMDLLLHNHSLATLLGDGPHFHVSADSDEIGVGLGSIKHIRYLTSSFLDHRSALAALDLLQTETISEASQEVPDNGDKESAIYLPDYIPYGTWTTSQTFTFADSNGVVVGKGSIGNGFIDAELPNFQSSSRHDLMVGLLCFDKIYFPVHGIGKLYADLGAAAFWSLIGSDAFCFIWKQSTLGILFGVGDDAHQGKIACVTMRSRENPEMNLSLADVIFSELPQESQGDKQRAELLSKFEKLTRLFDDSVLVQHPRLTEGILLSPRLRTHIGLGDGILPTSIPEWFVFPALRVAAVVQDAEICRILGVSAAKMPFGSDSLANAAYGIVPSKNNASDYANYVVGGRFKADLGDLVMRNSELLARILKFRETSIGEKFRSEIFSLLKGNAGSEFTASVNSVLTGSIPTEVLDKARDYFVDVHFSQDNVSVMSAEANVADPFLPWRKRSASILRDICSAKKIQPYDFCPCGSGDKLKFCCGTLFR